MFKEENRIWWYLLGVIVAIVIFLFFSRDYLIPVILGKKSYDDLVDFEYSTPPVMSIDLTQNYFARLITNKGVIVIDLFEYSAPSNVNNFVFLAEQNFYDGTKFHRLINDFLVQGGDRNTLDNDPANDGRGNPGYFISDEVNWDSLNLSEDKKSELASKGYTSSPGLISMPLSRFSVAMAPAAGQTGDFIPNSNGSQFFIVVANPSDPRLDTLNGYFTVIGNIYSGADVIDGIVAAGVVSSEDNDLHLAEDIIIQDVQIFVR